MKTTALSIMLILLCTIKLSAQTEFEEYFVGNGIYGMPLDIDGDGDIDIVAEDVVSGLSSIVWYQNIDGNGNFTTQQFIFDGFNANDRAHVKYGADFDGDNDIDLIISLCNDLTWCGPFYFYIMKNDGNGNFEDPVQFGNSYDSDRIAFGDFDDDGNMDIIISKYVEESTELFFNTNGDGIFGTAHLIPGYYSNLLPTDIDGDDYPDLLFPCNSSVCWKKNLDGLGNFSDINIIPNENIPILKLYTADVDNDGDSDVVSTNDESLIIWYENLDSMGSFSAQQIISSNLEEIKLVKSGDIDDDGDIDLLSLSSEEGSVDDIITWHENIDGQGDFYEEHNITINRQIRSFFISDMNNNGKLNVITNKDTYPSTYEVFWYGIMDPLSINKNTKSNFVVYPNPTSNILNIQSNVNLTKIELYDSLGKKILSNSNLKEIDLSIFNRGIYFIKITDEYGSYEFKKIIKE